jgi:tetratricopeptide (TPR) repeat protein
VAEATLAELKDPSVVYLPAIRKARAEGNLAGALAVADEAMEVFPAEGFGKAHANLRALRGGVRLDVARAGGKGRLKPEQLKDVQADAEAAVAGGEAVEGNYLLGRIAEESGAMRKAEGAYRAAVEAHGAAGGGQAFAKDHPGCDVTGHRYRAALARVLLAQAGGGGAGAAGGLRQDRPNEGGGGGQNPPKKEGGGGENPPNKEGGGGQKPPIREGLRQDAPAGGVGVGVVYQGPPLLVWTGCGCSNVLAVPVLMVDPAAVVDVEGMGQAPNPRLEEAIRLAKESIKRAEAGECDDAFEGYLILGEALGLKHKWTDGLMAYVEGLRHRCKKDAVGLTFLVSNHPAFKRLDSIEPPDPLMAEAYFAKGLRFYFDRRYEDAERELLEAVHYSDQDARYQYFLGLARLAQQGKRDMALEDFRQAARLEKQDRPNRFAVSAALERVQGPARRILNEIRDRER